MNDGIFVKELPHGGIEVIIVPSWWVQAEKAPEQIEERKAA